MLAQEEAYNIVKVGTRFPLIWVCMRSVNRTCEITVNGILS